MKQSPSVLSNHGSRFHRLFQGETRNKRFYTQYLFLWTIAFLIVSTVMITIFWKNGASVVFATDGRHQHYTALMYYGTWLRQIVKSIFQGELIIPQWNFGLGYGGDVISTLSYYVIGDPLALLSALVPTKYTYYLYYFLILFRMYLCGISFSCLCFFTTKTSRLSVLSGALIYTFSGYAFFASVRHPYFINPMIYLPLILLGVERVLRLKKPALLVLMVFVAAASNFYFFYMIAFFTALYVILRLLCLYGKALKQAFSMAIKLFLYCLLGTAMSSIVLLPTLYLFLGDGRTQSIGRTVELFYQPQYYQRFLTGLITPITIGSWSMIGVSALSILGIYALFRKRNQHLLLKIAFITLTVFTLFPVFGLFLNGFSYVSNRWVWAYILLLAFILTTVWKDILAFSKKDVVIITGLLCVYFAICVSTKYGRIEQVFVALFFVVIALSIISVVQHPKQKRFVSAFLAVLVTASVALNSFYLYDAEERNYVEDFLPVNELDRSSHYAIDAAISKIKKQEQDEDFSRYSSIHSERQNVSLHSQQSSVAYYWSLSNANIADFYTTVGLNSSTYNYRTLDTRYILNTLAGVKYLYRSANEITDDTPVYGYSYLDEVTVRDNTSLNEKESYAIYKAQNPLPLGYTYATYTTYEDFMSLSAVDREDSLLEGIVLEEALDGYDKTALVSATTKQPYTVTPQTGVALLDDNQFLVTRKNATMTLTFDGLTNSESYLALDGIDFEGKPRYELYFDDTGLVKDKKYTAKKWDLLTPKAQQDIKTSYENYAEPTSLTFGVTTTNTAQEKTKTKLKLFWKTNRSYVGRHDFLIQLGYDTAAKQTVKISFPATGIYSFDDISIYCREMSTVDEKVQTLKQDTLQNVAIAQDAISGTISLDTPKILCLSIPYSTGWTAYVDGAETTLLKGNLMYMALPLSAGDHTISLKYETPLLKLGFLISLFSFLLFIIVLVIINYRKKNV